MKKGLICFGILIFIMFSFPIISAATIYAESPSSAHIQTAIDLANDGDTIMVPAGSATWTGDVTIPSTKGISLIGAGIGNTNIALNGHYMALNTREANSRVRVSGFSFINTTESCFRINWDYAVGATDWRVDHCEWTGTTVLGAKVGIRGYTFGVFDNCIFNEQGRVFFIDGRTEPFDTGGYPGPVNFPGAYFWTQPLDAGGKNHVYIEDCTVINTLGTIMFNTRGGSKTVIRHNNFIGPIGIETHSGCTPGYRNPRWIEIYENAFNSTTNYWAAMFIRSTNGMIYNNFVSSYYPTVIRFDYEMGCLTSCISPWPSANTLVYPAQDQIGAGIDTGWGTSQSTSEAKLRIWNNIQNGLNANPYFSSCDNSAALIQHNRDYWQQITPFTGASGIGVGTLANRPSSGLTTGVYYWATDTNTLYRAISATNWETYYTPYTYPHPLRLDDGEEIPSIPDTASPVRTLGAPTGNLSAGTTSTTIGLTTDEIATCKYSTTSSISYNSMANTFSTTGSTSHSQLITGLTDGNTYNYYVKCIDNFGNANSNDYVISFHVLSSMSEVVTIQDMLSAYQQYKTNEVSLLYFLNKLRNWIVFW